MSVPAYLNLIRYKQWADRGLYEIVDRTFDRLDRETGTILLRVLDHAHIVDRIFQHHLQGVPHAFRGPRSEEMPGVRRLADDAACIDDWYVSYVGSLPALDFEQTVNFVFTSGKTAPMTRGDIILHVCLHGTYHRGNAGILLQKSGILPNDDRMTEFLEAAA